jgi:hypothetical protein
MARLREDESKRLGESIPEVDRIVRRAVDHASAKMAGLLQGKTVSKSSKVQKSGAKVERTLSKVFLGLEKLKDGRPKVFLALEKLKYTASKVFWAGVKT